MEGARILRNSQIIILGIFIALGTLGAAYIFSQGLVKVKKISTELISVTGSAEKKIVSDYMVWRASFSARDPQMTMAYQKIQDNLKSVKTYLVSKGVKESEINISSIQTDVLYRKNERGYATNDIEAYRLTQNIEVRSNDIDKVTQVSNESTELINQGIELISNMPEYFYTRLGELKIEMLQEASKDAKKRAEEIATSSGNKIGAIRSARMGVFQITPVNSYDTSDLGVNDTTSLEKRVTAVVKAEFAIQD